MQLIKIALISVSVALGITPVLARFLSGGSVDLKYVDIGDASTVVENAAIAAQLGPVGLQRDVGAWLYSEVSTTDCNFGLHLFSDVTPEFKLGLLTAGRTSRTDTMLRAQRANISLLRYRLRSKFLPDGMKETPAVTISICSSPTRATVSPGRFS